jgi:sensor histidine kinase YesM
MTDYEKVIDHLFVKRRWVVHVIFWLVILLLYVVFFGRQNSNYVQTFFFVGLLMPITICTTYFLNYVLIPRYLMKERYGFFLLYFVYTLVGSLFFEMSVAMITFLIMAEIRIQNMSPASFDIFFLLTSLLMVVFLGMAIKLLLHWRKSKEDYQRLLLEKVETELKFLKAQLNPHFLFNTLNNLYYLTLEKSDKAPKAVLQLSEILDYVMHSGKVTWVSLRTELKQMENYIGLESLRYQDRLRVEISVTGPVEDRVIGPMILISLVENAFKHGVMSVSGAAWIRIGVSVEDEKLLISMSNKWKQHESRNGIGLDNLRGQLSLLYGDKFDLRIDADNERGFLVNLLLANNT